MKYEDLSRAELIELVKKLEDILYNGNDDLMSVDILDAIYDCMHEN